MSLKVIQSFGKFEIGWIVILNNFDIFGYPCGRFRSTIKIEPLKHFCFREKLNIKLYRGSR